MSIVQGQALQALKAIVVQSHGSGQRFPVCSVQADCARPCWSANLGVALGHCGWQALALWGTDNQVCRGIARWQSALRPVLT